MNESSPQTAVMDDPNIVGARMEVDLLGLNIYLTEADGSRRHVHLTQDRELHLAPKGSESEGLSALSYAKRGRIVVALGVDDDYDGVHFDIPLGELETEELFTQGIEALQVALEAVRRARR